MEISRKGKKKSQLFIKHMQIPRNTNHVLVWAKIEHSKLKIAHWRLEVMHANVHIDALRLRKDSVRCDSPSPAFLVNFT